MLVAVDVAEYGAPDISEDEVRHDWSQAGFDPALDARLIRDASGAVIACAEVRLRGESLEFDGFADVHPQHADGPWMAPLLAWMRSRVMARAAGTAASLGIYCTRGNTRKAAALAAAGFACDRVILRMRIDLPETPPVAPPHRDGLVIAEFVPGVDDAALHAVLDEAFRDHYRSHPSTLDAWRSEQLGDPQFEARHFLVARVDGAVVGGLMGFDRDSLGWVARVGVIEAGRGRGVARAMLIESFARFHAAGRRHVELGVDSQNATGATKLYESVGMRTVMHHELWRTEVSTA